MKVELLNFVSTNLATGKEVILPQYKVVVDGTTVGYKGWKFGTPVCFIGRLSPTDKLFIQEEVQGLLGDNAGGVMPVEYSPEDSNDEDYVEDDFSN